MKTEVVGCERGVGETHWFAVYDERYTEARTGLGQSYGPCTELFHLQTWHTDLGNLNKSLLQPR